MNKVIIGTGSDLPEWTLTNDDIERMTSDYDRARSGVSLDEWVRERVGVEVRHRVRPGEGTSDMGTRAAQRALSAAGISPEDVDLIVMSTVTSDTRLPMSAARVQANLGCTCKFFQLEHACSGFIDALIVADGLMDSLGAENVLVLSAEAASFILDPNKFMMQTIFGDGAGAVVLQRNNEEADGQYGLMALYSEADGRIGEWMHVPAGATWLPITEDVLETGLQYLQLEYKKVYPYAVDRMAHSCHVVAEKAGIDLDDVAWFIPHQAGLNMALDIARRLEQPKDKFFLNIDHTGNTSGASIPLALDEANRAGLLKRDDLIIMPAMGAGIAWGAALLRWYTNGAQHEPGGSG